MIQQPHWWIMLIYDTGLFLVPQPMFDALPIMMVSCGKVLKLITDH